MSELTVKFKVTLKRDLWGRAATVVTGPSEVTPVDAQPQTPSAKPARPHKANDRLAQQLALAYYIQRGIDAGTIRNFAEAARIIGVSRARITQLMRLLRMPVEEQEQILAAVSAAIA